MHSKYSILIEKSIRAKKNSYSPYSRFAVGAALLTKTNKIYTGTNVENASYSLSICAERVAFSKAVSEGDKKFTAIAIAANGNKFVFPCGACRQFMFEFGSDIDVIIVRTAKQFRIVKLLELLPGAFDKTFLNIK
ncbi:MAG: cytidine deaminase [Ignavibacteria bacterium]|nr:cytidine deaminase [Ignavibacteria bacterium]